MAGRFVMTLEDEPEHVAGESVGITDGAIADENDDFELIQGD